MDSLNPKRIQHLCIGIQARSQSVRFPRKVFEMIGDKPMLRHVIDTCDKAAYYINRHTQFSRIRASLMLLVPDKDEITKAFSKRGVEILEGPEHDVLTRYMKMAQSTEADYIARVTADCPLLPDHLISKLGIISIKNSYDYCSNVDENLRTAIDGYDVEVMSRRALEWADQNTKGDLAAREHVTQILRSNDVPPDFLISLIQGNLDQSHIKLSVDTPEDLERVKIEYHRLKEKRDKAEARYERMHVHRY